jgi:hypothetical protein
MSLVGTWDVIKMSSEYQGKTTTFTKSQLDSIGLVYILKFEENGSVELTTNKSRPLVTFPGE